VRWGTHVAEIRDRDITSEGDEANPKVVHERPVRKTGGFELFLQIAGVGLTKKRQENTAK